jgi:hypothetical protein
MFQKNNRIFFFISICFAFGFYFSRSHVFDIPFFWDEAWVYGPAVKSMGNQWCFLPSCAGDLSRGHPLLFHFLGGVWIKIFGDSNYSLHFFAFSISLALFFSCYYIVLKWYGAKQAVFLSALVVVQNLIFSQSAMVYPEILLTLFALWTFYFFCIKNRLLFVLFGFLMCLVKEQGVVIISAILFWEILTNLFRYSFRYFVQKEFFLSFFLFLLQLSGLLIFLLLQKFQKGYWFFPEHIGMIKTDFRSIFYQFKLSCHHLFLSNGRFILTAIIFSAFIFFSKKFNLLSRVSLVVVISLIMISLTGVFRVPNLVILLAIFFILSVILSSFEFVELKEFFSSRLGLISSLIISYLFFCAFNFFTLRYLAILVPFLFLFFYECATILMSVNKFQTIILSFILLFSVFFLSIDKSIGDVSPRNYQAVLTQKEIIDRLILMGAQKQAVYTSFLMRNNLNRAASGFVPSDNFFPRSTNYLLPDSAFPSFVVHLSFEKDSAINAFLSANGSRYNSVDQVNFGDSKGIIYQLK